MSTNTPPDLSRRDQIRANLHEALEHRAAARRRMRRGAGAAVVLCAATAAWMIAAQPSRAPTVLPPLAHGESPIRRTLPTIGEIAVGRLRVEVLGNLSLAQLAARGVGFVSDDEAASIVEEAGPEFGVILTDGRIELVRTSPPEAMTPDHDRPDAPREPGPGSQAPAAPTTMRAG